MLSMVTIIVALASKADFTFMDEPVAGLDVVMRDYFYHKLMEEYTETGRTFVISTHIIEEATDLMEEVVMIKNGEVLLKENTQELLERSYHVSGLAEVVDQATEGYERHHEEKMGRSKSVTILLEEGQKLPEGYDVTILNKNPYTTIKINIMPVSCNPDFSQNRTFLLIILLSAMSTPPFRKGIQAIFPD